MNRLHTSAAALLVLALSGSGCAKNKTIPNRLAPSRMTAIGVNAYLWRAALDTVSFAWRDLRADTHKLAEQAALLGTLLRHLVSLPTFPRDTLFNVNLPPLSASEVKGVKLTRLGRRVYSNSLTPMSDPWGRRIFWIGGGSAEWSGEADSDFQAVRESYISVTPLHLDLTHFDVLSSAEAWWRDP